MARGEVDNCVEGEGVLNVFVTFLACKVLCACASVTKACIASGVQAVTEDQLKEFWQAKNEPLLCRASTGCKPVSDCGNVIVHFLAYTNNAILNPEILESEPAGVFERTALEYLGLVHCIPAKSNPGHKPVKTTLTARGQECEFQT